MIEIADFLEAAAIQLELEADTKQAALKELTSLLFGAYPALGKVMRATDASQMLVEREALAATGVGNGVAIPHAASERIRQLYGGFARSTAGLDFGAVDGRRCHLFLVLLCPSTNPKMRIKALSRISRALGDQSRREALMAAGTTDEMYRILVPTADEGAPVRNVSGTR
jgi:mannitol/fructose-specific phosphotransferase system IIA component (Ntr-type)